MAFATATALMMGGMGLMAAGSIQEGRIVEAEQKASARMEEYNARISEQNAEAAKQKTIFDMLRQRRRGRKIMGTLRARLAASGAMLTEGAPEELLTEQYAELELENALIGYEGQIQASRYMSEAAISRMRRDIAEQRAGYAKTAGYMKAGATLLTGFGYMGSKGMLAGG